MSLRVDSDPSEKIRIGFFCALFFLYATGDTVDIWGNLKDLLPVREVTLRRFWTSERHEQLRRASENALESFRGRKDARQRARREKNRKRDQMTNFSFPSLFSKSHKPTEGCQKHGRPRAVVHVGRLRPILVLLGRLLAGRLRF